MDIIQQIRSANGFDKDLLDRAQTDPALATPILALRANLDRALNCLSVELYSRPTQFLLEFIQNADDNAYSNAESPTLEVTLDRNRISIECNELGFTEEDVWAICRIGASTKTTLSGYIGEKGIGFKSVFKVADVVSVSSNRFSFKFDKNTELGMITPVWTAYPLAVRPGWTQFSLKLSNSTDKTDMRQQLSEIHPSILLFLHKLRALKVEIISRQGRSVSRSVYTHQVVPKDENVVSLMTTESLPTHSSSSYDYFVFRHLMRMTVKDEKRKDVTETEIVLAFPISEEGKPLISPQNVHAFLPIKSYNFTFIIQADFLTQSGREGILTDRAWNKKLCKGIVFAFCSAIDRFKQHSMLQHKWIEYLPENIHDPSFMDLEESIITQLSKSDILQSRNGSYYLPKSMVIIPQIFLDGDSKPLIDEHHFTTLHYLSESYNTQDHYLKFVRLGVRDLTLDDFIEGLFHMNDEIHHQTEEWHERVCEILYNKINTLYSNDAERSSTIFELKRLCIIPLSDGTWTEFSDDILFDSQSVVIPKDLDLRLVDRRILPSSFRYHFLESLGVKNADSEQIAKTILQLHRDLLKNLKQRTIPQLINHAKFMFDYRESLQVSFANDLLIITSNLKAVSGTHLYMDDFEDPTKLRMSDIMPPPARFLHDVYLEQYAGEGIQKLWLTWLRDDLRINTAPRIVAGRLSAEFKALVQNTPTLQLLHILRENWSQIRNNGGDYGHHEYMKELSNINVACTDGIIRKLSTTYLRTRQLSQMRGLHFLPIDDTDLRGWAFLGDLGVGIELTAKFFINHLVGLQKERCTDEAEIEQTYIQLQTRCNDGEGTIEMIQHYFAHDPLIYVDGNWLDREGVVWGGPAVMTVKVDISRYYRNLKRLFHSVVGIEPAPDEILAQELRTLVRGWEGKPISNDFRNDLLRILIAICHQLRDHPDSSTWIREILDEPIFPVNHPSNSQPTLYTWNHTFFISDNSGKLAEIFRHDIPLLLFSMEEMVDLKPVLNFFDLDSKLLSKLVVEKTYVKDAGLEDLSDSALYASKAEYFNRLVYFSHSKRTPGLLRRLQDIKVFNVGILTSTFSLSYNDMHLEKSHPKESLADQTPAGKLVIYKNNNSSPTLHSLCSALAEYLEVDRSRVYCIVRTPNEEMEEYLRSEGIAHVSLDDDQIVVDDTASWLSSPTSEEIPFSSASEISDDEYDYRQDEVIHRNAPDADASEGLGEFDRTPFSSMFQSADPPSQVQRNADIVPEAASHEVFSHPDHSAYTEHPSTGETYRGEVGQQTMDAFPLSQNPPPVASVVPQPPILNSEPEPQQTNPFMPTPYEPNVNTLLIPTFGSGPPQPTEDTTLIGIIGEAYVYRALFNMLPNFDYKNWTSELREYEGFPRYEWRSFSDFVYVDSQGVLSGMIYGEHVKQQWAGRWPRYYIEVKTTPGDMIREFHMSEPQIQMARELKRHSFDHPPRQVYVIFGISKIFSPHPSLTMFPDPHHLFYFGQLEIASEVTIRIRFNNV